LVAAWCGYGPGILVSVATLIFIPHLGIPKFPLVPIDLNRICLVLLISVLISKVSDTRTRTEEALRKSNEELDKKIRLRTEDLERANAALIELKAKGVKFLNDTPIAGHANSRIAFLDPTTTANILIEIAEMPAGHAHGSAGVTPA